MNTGQILNKLSGVKKTAGSHMAKCPAHEDKTASLSIKTVEDGKTILHCFAGCSTDDILTKIGLTFADLYDDAIGPIKNEPIVYDYTDETGKLVYQVERTQGKDFFHRTPNGQGGYKYKEAMKDVEKLPYRFPEVIKAMNAGETVYVCEGEKDCDRLASLGLTATTNSGGAGKWFDLSKHFKGASVIVFPDNDPPSKSHPEGAGQAHAKQVADSLTGIAASVKIVMLPDLPEKGDVSDWLAAGHTKEELLELIETKVGSCNPSNFILPTFIKPLCETPITDQEWLIDGFLVDGAISSIFADGGKGKSYIAMYAGVCIALGEPFLKRKVSQGRVVYLDFELSASQQVRRLSAICKGFGVELETLNDSLMYFAPGSPENDETEPAQLSEIIPLIEQVEFKLIIIDSVGVAMSGDGESSSDVCAWFQNIRKLGSVLVLDHHSKLAPGQKASQKTEFGSAYKRNLSRNVWQLNSSDDGARGIFEHKKANLTEKQKPFGFKVSRTADTYMLESTDVSSEFSEHLSIRKQIEIALEQEGKRTTQEVADELGLSITQVKPEMSRLKSDKIVVPVGKQGRAKTYDVIRKVETASSPETEDDSTNVATKVAPNFSKGANTPTEQVELNVGNTTTLGNATCNVHETATATERPESSGTYEVEL